MMNIPHQHWPAMFSQNRIIVDFPSIDFHPGPRAQQDSPALPEAPTTAAWWCWAMNTPRHLRVEDHG